MKGHTTRHEENLKRLARIEGQIRGISRMVGEGAYCVDILTQIQAAQAALGAVARRIMRKHIGHCVADAMRGGSREEADEKARELIEMLERQIR